MSDYTLPKVETLSLSRSCKLETTHYSWGTECELTYTEHSQDHWHSDNETSIDIDKETACAMIKFLTNFVNKE